MGYTTNYNLYTTNDDTEHFQNFREALCGNVDSNMTKIDAALSEKADSSVYVSGVLAPDDWVGDAVPYTYTLSVSGITSDTNGTIGLPPFATLNERNEAKDASVFIGSQADGTITLVADGKKPTIGIPYAITITN